MRVVPLVSHPFQVGNLFQHEGQKTEVEPGVPKHVLRAIHDHQSLDVRVARDKALGGAGRAAEREGAAVVRQLLGAPVVVHADRDGEAGVTDQVNLVPLIKAVEDQVLREGVLSAVGKQLQRLAVVGRHIHIRDCLLLQPVQPGSLGRLADRFVFGPVCGLVSLSAEVWVWVRGGVGVGVVGWVWMWM